MYIGKKYGNVDYYYRWTENVYILRPKKIKKTIDHYIQLD